LSSYKETPEFKSIFSKILEAAENHQPAGNFSFIKKDKHTGLTVSELNTLKDKVRDLEKVKLNFDVFIETLRTVIKDRRAKDVDVQSIIGNVTSLTSELGKLGLVFQENKDMKIIEASLPSRIKERIQRVANNQISEIDEIKAEQKKEQKMILELQAENRKLKNELGEMTLNLETSKDLHSSNILPHDILTSPIHQSAESTAYRSAKEVLQKLKSAMNGLQGSIEDEKLRTKELLDSFHIIQEDLHRYRTDSNNIGRM